MGSKGAAGSEPALLRAGGCHVLGGSGSSLAGVTQPGTTATTLSCGCAGTSSGHQVHLVLLELLQLNNAELAHGGSDRAGSASFSCAGLRDVV